MNQDDRIEKTSAVDRAFMSGSVWQAKDSELAEYLQTLSTGYVDNDKVRHREIIRGITINHIQMSRFIGRLDEDQRQARTASDQLAKRVVLLTIVATVAGVLQAIVAIIQLCRK